MRKGEELQQNKGWKWEVGTGRGGSAKDKECSRKIESGRGVAGVFRFLVNLRICSLSVLESCKKHCLHLFLCMAVKQCYRRRRKDLELELCKWTTSEDS